MRRTSTWVGIALASALAGCGRSDTGVHIFARTGALEYDELQFQVTSSGGEVVVDPMTTGRYQAPFSSGDQDVLVYLRDELVGSQLHCEASALRAGGIVSRGAGDVTVVRGEMKDVEIVMIAPDGTGGGGSGGSGDVSGGGGGGGTGGGGPGGSGSAPGKPNGEACSLDGECATGHCADGVCCESDCKMGCHSCALIDSPGLCRAVAGGGPDPHGMCHDQGPASCKQTGLCGVDGTCALYPAGTACASAGCEGAKAEFVVSAGVCDGAGKCEMPAKIKCGEDTTCVAGVCTQVQSRLP